MVQFWFSILSSLGRWFSWPVFIFLNWRGHMFRAKAVQQAGPYYVMQIDSQAWLKAVVFQVRWCFPSIDLSHGALRCPFTSVPICLSCNRMGVRFSWWMVSHSTLQKISSEKTVRKRHHTIIDYMSHRAWTAMLAFMQQKWILCSFLAQQNQHWQAFASLGGAGGRLTALPLTNYCCIHVPTERSSSAQRKGDVVGLHAW